MQITFFSFCMAWLWSNFVILFLYLLRKSSIIISFFSVSGILMIYLACITRLVLPLEMPVTHVIVSSIFSKLITVFMFKPLSFLGWNLTIGTIMIVIWITGAVILLFILFHSYYSLYLKIKFGHKQPNETLYSIFEEIVPDHKKKRYYLYTHKSIRSPMSCGIFNKYILFTDREFEYMEAYCIMKHEYTHLANHDTLVQLLLNILCCIYWWNPLIHVLFDNLKHITEIKCDLISTAEMGVPEKAEYLQAMLHSYDVDGSMETEFDSKDTNTKHFFERDSDILMERLNFITKYANVRGKKILTGCIVALFVLTYVYSYMFIVQSDFEIPTEEVITEKYDHNNSKEGYIIKYQDNTYQLIIPDKSSMELNEQVALEMQAHGFQLIIEGDKIK